jgi:DNA-binding transcriptional MerR regulator
MMDWIQLETANGPTVSVTNETPMGERMATIIQGSESEPRPIMTASQRWMIPGGMGAPRGRYPRPLFSCNNTVDLPVTGTLIISLRTIRIGESFTMMTIGQFSERTGLGPKTLRYYEEVELLSPGLRSENGYRQYADAQVAKAHLISSLRQAGVSVAEIRAFLDSDQTSKEALLVRWREEAATKLLSIQVANQFLNGLDSHTKHVHLLHWDQPRNLCWFAIAGLKGPAEWQSAAERHQRQLVKAGLAVERSTYLRFNDGHEGEIGFVITEKSPPADQKVEAYGPTLFATLECHDQMAHPCKPIFATVRRFGFRPVGSPLRKYLDATAFLEGRYLLMLPVAHL